jgi:hypothetical protein
VPLDGGVAEGGNGAGTDLRVSTVREVARSILKPVSVRVVDSAEVDLARRRSGQSDSAARIVAVVALATFVTRNPAGEGTDAMASTSSPGKIAVRSSPPSKS